MEKKATYLPPTFLRDLQKVVELYRRIGLLDKLPMPSSSIDQATPIYFKNVSGETIPPYACMQVTGTVEEGSQNYLEVDKPADTDGTAGQFLFNGHNEVASNDTGIAQDCAVVRAFKNTGTIVAGDLYGPTVNQWYLTKDAGSYVAAGDDDIASNVFKVFVSVGGGSGGEAILAVTPVGGISARTDTAFPLVFPSAVCSKVDPETGNYFDPSESVTVFNSTNIAISAQSLIQAKKIGSMWFVDVDNCGDVALDLPEVAEPPPPP